MLMSVNLQQPMGNGTTPFTYSDLVTTLQQDAWTTVVYFPGYGTDKIICTDSVLNPAIQWCAPKAETWEPPAYKAVIIPVIPQENSIFSAIAERDILVHHRSEERRVG